LRAQKTPTNSCHAGTQLAKGKSKTSPPAGLEDTQKKKGNNPRDAGKNSKAPDEDETFKSDKEKRGQDQEGKGK